MKSLELFLLALLLALFTGCEPDPCDEVACGPGDCVEGVCDCPDGFTGDNCEIKLCFGVECLNGDCDPQTETCNCYPNYYGENCNILCENGAYENGVCNCSDGFEGIACEYESRCRFIGWWNCVQWTMAPQIGGATTPGALPGSIKIEKGFNVNLVEFFPTENSDGLMLLSSNNSVTGQVTENTINFELQNLTTERTVYGSAIFGDDQIFRMELFFFNPETSLTEVAKGTFRVARYIKE